MKRRSGAGGKLQGRKRSTPKRRNAPKATRNRGVSIASQETVIARLTHERDEALLRETANSEILSAMPSPFSFRFSCVRLGPRPCLSSFLWNRTATITFCKKGRASPIVMRISWEPTSVRQLEFGMRLIGNYYSEWADTRRDTRRTLLVTLVACAVGATASATVIFSLASSATTQSGVPPISPRAIVRNVAAPEVPKTVQDGSLVEPTPSPQVTMRKAGAFEVPKAARDEPVKQTEAERRAEVHSQQSRRHSRFRYPYWRRVAHNPFGSW